MTVKVPAGRCQDTSVSDRRTSSRPCPHLNVYRQLQTSSAVGEDRYNNMVDCFRKIIRNEGYARIYRD
jgi:hypothetical protein